MTYDLPTTIKTQAIYRESSNYDVDGIIDNRDGTSTILISCPSGKTLTFKYLNKKFSSINTSSLGAIIDSECE